MCFMKNNVIYIINAYTKDGVFDHHVGLPYHNEEEAQDDCMTYQSVCHSTGLTYKVVSKDYEEFLNEPYSME